MLYKILNEPNLCMYRKTAQTDNSQNINLFHIKDFAKVSSALYIWLNFCKVLNSFNFFNRWQLSNFKLQILSKELP